MMTELENWKEQYENVLISIEGRIDNGICDNEELENRLIEIEKKIEELEKLEN